MEQHHEHLTPEEWFGTTEPLTREQTISRLRELEAWGVDLGLVRDNLRRSPEARVRQNEGLAKLIAELQASVHAGRSAGPGSRHG